MQIAVKHSRLEARISPEIHALLKRAAELQGRTVSDFVVSVARDAALDAIEKAEVMRLSRESSEQFADLLRGGADIAPAMRRARQHHEMLIGPL